MNKYSVASIVVVAVMVGGFVIFNTYIYHEKQADTERTDSSLGDAYIGKFADQSIHISFDYPDGPNGYVVDNLSEFSGDTPAGVNVVAVYRIMNAKEKAELEASGSAREGPPAMQLMVFTNPQNQTASQWVNATPQFSNIDMLRGTIDTDVVVGGADAVRYTTDGLYLTDNVVVVHDEYVYYLNGSYLAEDSAIHQDFQDILDSVRFTAPTEASDGGSAKIDVRVACESALAYMLFQTSEQADQFVAECVAGEHPDVIERYIDGLGLDSATI